MYSLRLSIATIHALSLNSCGRQMLPLNMRALITSCTIDRPNALGRDGWKNRRAYGCHRSYGTGRAKPGSFLASGRRNLIVQVYKPPSRSNLATVFPLPSTTRAWVFSKTHDMP